MSRSCNERGPEGESETTVRICGSSVRSGGQIRTGNMHDADSNSVPHRAEIEDLRKHARALMDELQETLTRLAFLLAMSSADYTALYPTLNVLSPQLRGSPRPTASP